jgi:hypothetical protein
MKNSRNKRDLYLARSQNGVNLHMEAVLDL